MPSKNPFVAQVNALQKAAQEAFDTIAKEIEAKHPKSTTEPPTAARPELKPPAKPSEEYKMLTEIKSLLQDAATERKAKTKEVSGQLKFNIVRDKNNNGIKHFDMPEGFELRLSQGLAIYLKTKHHIRSNNLNEFAWITCDLVAESCVGEAAMHLLTPTPLRITSTSNLNKEYVPVERTKFSLIELKMFTNLRTLKASDGPYNVLVVLHFSPRHKRKRYNVECDSKKHCPDGCGGRILQQTSSREISQGGL